MSALAHFLESAGIATTLVALVRLHVEKVRAFRRQYGVEFYVCMVGSEEVIEDLRLDAYDECSPLSHMHTMVSRLAD